MKDPSISFWSLNLLLLSLLCIPNANGTPTTNGKQPSKHGHARKNSWDPLPELAVDNVARHLSHRDQFLFGMASKRFLAPAFQPENEERRALMRDCGQELTSAWLQHYFREPIVSPHGDSWTPAFSLHSGDWESWTPSGAVRSQFFQPQCLRALSAFCQQDQYRSKMAAAPVTPLQIDLGLVRASELHALLGNYRYCRTQLDVSIKGQESRAAFQALVLRSQDDTGKEPLLTFKLTLLNSFRAEPADFLIRLLKTNTRALKTLVLTSLKSADSFDRLLRALHQNGNVESLELLEIHHEQAEHIDVVSNALRANLRLQRFHLSGTEMLPEETRQLFRALLGNANLKELDLSQNGLSTFGLEVDVLEKVFGRPGCPIEHLDLYGNEFSPEAGVILGRALAKNRSLRRLSIGGNWLDSQGTAALVAPLVGHPKFESLDLTGVSMHTEGARAVAMLMMRNQNLRELIVARNDMSAVDTMVLLVALCHNRGLRYFKLDHNQVPVPAAVFLGSALAGSHSALEHVSLEATGLNDESLTYIALGLQRNIMLQRLDLAENEITSAGMEPLASVLARNRGLEDLELRGNKIDDIGAATLFSALASNHKSRLRYLSLSDNHVGFMHGAERVTREFGRPLADVKSLRVLHLSDNVFNDDTAMALAEDLVANTGLRFVTLDNNHAIGEDAANQIVEMMEDRSLELSLELPAEEVDDEEEVNE